MQIKMTDIMKLFYPVLIFLGVECQEPRYHGEFNLRFYGKLPSKDYQTIFSAENQTFGRTINQCSQFCISDQRCIGIEICQIRQDLFQCRVCCEWKKMGTNNIDEHPGCKYLEMENRGSENLAMNATMSTAYNINHLASNAVDGITTCIIESSPARVAHTDLEIRPWLKIILKNSVNVKEVLIYNRQDCCGEKFHNVEVNVTENGQKTPCGFYPGPGESKDRILFLCENGARGDGVIISIVRNEQPVYLGVCEVEVFGQP
ncbi:pentraxin fusion protein-like [Saccostrea cucullata]|uniref:pentraxin fusion protein-like n=1 Tax=Saccostrea cuccullata TaxID=36930 RepID=UPI002ED3F647